MSYLKKDEDADTMILRLDRASVLQEARLFNTSPIYPRKCRVLLTKIAALLFTGERFPKNEATTLFFNISKLFQNKDPALRQMVYLVLKELCGEADDVIMSTSIIMKDASAGSDVLYRTNAIRALCRIIDASTVPAIERLIKAAIVDKTPAVATAALVSSYHLLPIAKDIVRRWQSETQEAATFGKQTTGFFGFPAPNQSHAISQSNYTPQYHAIGLLYQMRAHDRMALVKMVQQYGAPGVVKSPAALLLLVRLAAKLARDDQNLRRPMMRHITDVWLKHKHEMVNFEAARAVCDVVDCTDEEARLAVNTLQLYLSSPRPVTKFTAIRILHQFASFKPNIVNSCNQDIEMLISYSNRSIATFAITTLLKTGNESSVDRLLTQISGFMAEITDEFKVTIVEAIRTLCLKFPNKQADMLTFLSGILRDEGGYHFKRSVVESMFDLIKFVPGSKEDALTHLCEFIEDCEFTKLAVRILHLLGVEGPKTPNPTKYVRYIYNRMALENAIVRAAAVSALARFGIGQKDLDIKSSVRVVLRRCLDDADDEVRDRAALNLRLMDEDDAMAQKFIDSDTLFSLSTFENQLISYVTSNDKKTFSAAFNISSVPVISREQLLAEERMTKLTSATPILKAPTPNQAEAQTSPAADTAVLLAASLEKYSAELALIPEIKAYGELLKSSAPVELTESETEYVVSAVKHIFKDHVVIQYSVKNTLPDTVLENVTVAAIAEDPEELTLEEDFVVPAPKISSGELSIVYVAFKKLDSQFAVASFVNNLKFMSKEIDPTTGEPEGEGYEDEYQVENIEVNGSDYVVRAFAPNFDDIWKGIKENGDEATETLQLSGVSSISDATSQLATALSLQPLDGTDVVLNNTSHALKLYGKTVTGGRVAALVRLVYSVKSGVTMKITALADEENIAPLIVSAVA